jgi:hypothetical protein
MEIIGSKPSPRILAWGISPESKLGVFINEIAPTVRFVQNVDDLRLVRQTEWDALILSGDPPTEATGQGLQEHLKVIQFGGSSITGYATTNPSDWIQIGIVLGSVATEFIIPEDIPSGIHRLVSAALLPWLQSRTANEMIIQKQSVGLGKVRDVITPFVMDADGRPLAGFIKLRSREWWWLPEETPNKDMWVAAALSEWSKSDPEKFPPEPIWVKRPQWQTKKERDAASTLETLREERDRVLADLQRREQELARQYEDSRREADRRDRRLLTAQGDALVEEVHASLEEIGFKVQDMDVEQAPKGILLEDLRVEDPVDNDWIALAEVRGYAGGAKVSDFQRIGRFVEHYIRTEGRAPSARWYIVNHNLNTDPSARPSVLAGGAEDVSIFESAGGLVIDTRILFTIRDQVRTGTLELEAARRSIRDAKGILRLPSP